MRSLLTLIFLILAAVIGIVVYALAFQQTEVRLDEITSETRQQSLARILRALAQPNLVTYDTEPTITEVELGVPCGPSGLATSPTLTAIGPIGRLAPFEAVRGQIGRIGQPAQRLAV